MANAVRDPEKYWSNCSATRLSNRVWGGRDADWCNPMCVTASSDTETARDTRGVEMKNCFGMSMGSVAI